ncbi:MAG: hypothetical protein COV76_02880 [Candidatus Omnitrophica bacterium CG11_big_fil_rev_8_21_14_0_20_64_10]|nr:MAG: hypothetical protein COV76_02880 [Candidatus Omnitrophica bacterium CG11_big_fil_rev_8_21_14_0_20_64_10]
MAESPGKGVVLLSGGLDSTLAARLLLEQGVELVGVYLSAPWGCCDKTKALKSARQLGIPCQVIKMTDEYIGVIRHPKYGYGSAMNPCIDCRIHMFDKAKGLMAQTGASFIVTGEVLGQRPMSQMRRSMFLIEEQAGLTGRIVRPLSAKVLPPTEPERLGWIDRERLCGITGRSRKIQQQLAEQFGILDYPNPAGGCQLTDKQFGGRVKDLFAHQERIDLEDMELLRFGRHFRVGPQTKLIVGRNEQENRTLAEYLGPGRLLFEPEFHGPWALAVGPPEAALQQVAVGAILRYAGAGKLPPRPAVICRVGRSREAAGEPLSERIEAVGPGLAPEELERIRI